LGAVGKSGAAPLLRARTAVDAGRLRPTKDGGARRKDGRRGLRRGAGRKSAEDRIAARESELGSSSDGPGGRSNREERRERAERLRSPLEALKDRFEARTFDAGDGKSIPYRLFKPQQRDAKTRVPLVVYLHGAGGRGTDNLKQITGGNLYGSRIWALSENQARHPCYVLAPQLTQGVSGPRKMAARGEKTADAVSDVAPAGKRAVARPPPRHDNAGQGLL